MFGQIDRSRLSEIGYAALLAIGVPAAVFHAVQDRWAQAILAAAAITVGVYILITDRREAAQSERRAS